MLKLVLAGLLLISCSVDNKQQTKRQIVSEYYVSKIALPVLAKQFEIRKTQEEYSALVPQDRINTLYMIDPSAELKEEDYSLTMPEAKSPSFQEIEAQLKSAANKYPDITRFGTYGVSDSGNSLFYLKITNKDQYFKPAVMITGSHNPPDFNGCKVCLGKSTIYGKEIQDIYTIISRGDYVTGPGSICTQDVMPASHDRIAGDITVGRNLKVVVDAGNGTGGRAAVPLLRRLGCDVIELYCEMDGRFPNHHPDPTVPANLHDLQMAVRRVKADLGIGFDGDGDRIGAIDEQGRIIWGDQLLILFSRDILAEHPGATFISEVKGSQKFYDDVKKRGGNAIMWKTGHSLIKAKMKETGALLAGEMSGHMFFAHRYYGFDDAVYAACRLVELLGKSDMPLSSLLSDVPKTFSTPELRVDCPDERKFAVIEKVKNAFQGSYDIIDIDGARIQMPGGWALVRASNTQPALVLRFEAQTAEGLKKIRDEIEGVVKEFI